MELVKGQNISLSSIQNLMIDIGWKSATADLNMQGFGIYYSSATDKGQLISSSNEQDSLVKIQDGRHFELNLEQLSNQMNRFAIVLFLPIDTKYNFNQVKNLQAFIYSNSGDKIATVKLNNEDSNAKSMHFLEVYMHKGEWKIKLLAHPLTKNMISLASSLRYELPDHLKPDSRTSEIDISRNTHSREYDLRDGVTLTMGASFSLSEAHSHITDLSWKTKCTPSISDITLNAVALNNQNRIRNIEDFVYNNNAILRGNGVQLKQHPPANASIEIDLNKLPKDITKLSLIATRESESKRFSSADFIQTKLESSHTNLPVCNFTCETANKNYNCIILLEIYKHNDQWKVKAIGQGYADGLTRIGEAFGFTAPKIRQTRITSSPGSVNSEIRTNEPINTHSQNTQSTSTPIQNIPKRTGFWGIVTTIIGSFLLLGSSTSNDSTEFFINLLISLACIATGGYLFLNARKQAKLVQQEENERFILNMIAQNNYQITPFEVAAHCVLTVEEATKILDNLCNKGAGRIKIHDNGSEVYTFEAMQSNTNNLTENW